VAWSTPHSPATKIEVFERRQPVIDHRLVRHPGHDLLGRDRIGEHIDAEHRDAAAVRL
jgi:hypothetical protein